MAIKDCFMRVKCFLLSKKGLLISFCVFLCILVLFSFYITKKSENKKIFNDVFVRSFGEDVLLDDLIDDLTGAKNSMHHCIAAGSVISNYNTDVMRNNNLAFLADDLVSIVQDNCPQVFVQYFDLIHYLTFVLLNQVVEYDLLLEYADTLSKDDIFQFIAHYFLIHNVLNQVPAEDIFNSASEILQYIMKNRDFSQLLDMDFVVSARDYAYLNSLKK